MSDRHLAILNRLSSVRALVVGDSMVDIYHFGRIDRLSPEAPVPIFVEHEVYGYQERRGGADNVAHQLETLGVKTVKHVSEIPSEKHRYMVDHHHVFRIDRDSSEMGRPYEGQFDFDVVILSDYKKGFLTESLCQQIIGLARCSGKPVVVDPKGSDWSKYHGSTVICPNEKEWHEWFIAEPFGMKDIAPFFLRKKGSRGLQLLEYKCPGGYPDGPRFSAQAKHVYDVTGAGDTVVAVFSACLATGAPKEDCAHIANVAAGYVVGEIGTTVCPFDKLSQLCSSDY